MQPGNRMMTSIQMWKGHQFNTLTAWQKMMAAQQENISQDNCMRKERIIKHNAIWAEEEFFFFFNQIFRTGAVMPRAFHSFLPEEYSDKSKEAVWITVTTEAHSESPNQPRRCCTWFLAGLVLFPSRKIWVLVNGFIHLKKTGYSVRCGQDQAYCVCAILFLKREGTWHTLGIFSCKISPLQIQFKKLIWEY